MIFSPVCPRTPRRLQVRAGACPGSFVLRFAGAPLTRREASEQTSAVASPIKPITPARDKTVGCSKHYSCAVTEAARASVPVRPRSCRRPPTVVVPPPAQFEFVAGGPDESGYDWRHFLQLVMQLASPTAPGGAAPSWLC